MSYLLSKNEEVNVAPFRKDDPAHPDMMGRLAQLERPAPRWSVVIDPWQLSREIPRSEKSEAG
jgi:hypothetical protein